MAKVLPLTLGYTLPERPPEYSRLDLATAHALVDRLIADSEAGHEPTVSIQSGGTAYQTIVAVNGQSVSCTRALYEVNPRDGHTWVHLEIGGVWFRGIVREPLDFTAAWAVHIRRELPDA